MIFFFTFKALQLFLKITKSILSSAQTRRQKLEDQFKLITHSHIFSSCSSVLFFGQYSYSSTSSAWESAQLLVATLIQQSYLFGRVCSNCFALLTHSSQLNVLPYTIIVNETMPNPKSQKQLYCINSHFSFVWRAMKYKKAWLIPDCCKASLAVNFHFNYS